MADDIGRFQLNNLEMRIKVDSETSGRFIFYKDEIEVDSCQFDPSIFSQTELEVERFNHKGFELAVELGVPGASGAANGRFVIYRDGLEIDSGRLDQLVFSQDAAVAELRQAGEKLVDTYLTHGACKEVGG